MRTLSLPPGAEAAPVSQGTVAYIPYREDHTNPASRWLVDVPDEAADGFLGIGGFALITAPASERSPVNYVRMFHPEGGVCDAFDRDADGFHLVPNGPAVAEMRSHGFKVEGDEETPKPSVVPAEIHASLAAAHAEAVSHIAHLEEVIREHERDAKMMKDRFEALQGEMAALKEKKPEDDKKAKADK